MNFTKTKRKIMTDIALNSSLKAAVVIDELDDMFLRAKLGDSLNLLSENFAHEARAVIVYKSHVLYPCFKAKHDQLIESGFVVHWQKAFLVRSQKRVSGPTVLTMEHLEAGFLVWIYSIVFSVIVFIAELLHSNYLKLLEFIQSPFIFVTFKVILSKWFKMIGSISSP